MAHVTDYECALCGKTAWRGKAITIVNVKPWEHKLDLECPNPKHHTWTVVVKCPKCGKVPKYMLRRYEMRAGKPVPVLECCGKAWEPEGHGPNPFADERTI